MDRHKLERAVAETQRFLSAANDLLKATPLTYQGHGIDYKPEPWDGYGDPIHQGAVRRASMDLTRALADLRRRPS